MRFVGEPTGGDRAAFRRCDLRFALFRHVQNVVYVVYSELHTLAHFASSGICRAARWWAVLRAQFNAEEPVPAKESRAAMDETAEWFRGYTPIYCPRSLKRNAREVVCRRIDRVTQRGGHYVTMGTESQG